MITFPEANSFISFLLQYAFQVVCGSHDLTFFKTNVWSVSWMTSNFIVWVVK
jgi:hypothetical protein